MKSVLFAFCLLAFTTTSASAQSYLVEQPQLGYGRYLTGGLTSMLVGFGAGQAVQGRYAQKGWIFTAGETASVGVMASGYMWMLPNLTDGNPMPAIGLMLAGAASLIVFRTWGVVDAWSAPYASGSNTAHLNSTSSTTLAFMPWISSQGAGLLVNF